MGGNAAEVARLRSTARDLRSGYYGPILPELGLFFECVAQLVHDEGAVLDVDIVNVERELAEALEDHP